MLISLAKLYTAFNLSPQDLADLLHLLPTPPVILRVKLLPSSTPSLKKKAIKAIHPPGKPI